MMNLTIVSPYPPTITGISQYGYNVSRILAHSGIFTDITILAGASSAGKVLGGIPENVTVEYAWQQENPGAGLAIVSRLSQLKPDLIWYNLGASIFGRSMFANLASYLSLSLGRLQGTPTVVTLHELVQLSDLQSINVPGGRLVQYGAGLLMNSAIHADVICLTLRRYVSWLSSHRPDLTFMHIPIGAVHTPELLPESHIPELLLFTTHAPFKGLEILLTAYCELLRNHPALKLTIAGAEHPRFPGYLDSVRRKYKSLPGIKWLGQVSDEQVHDLFERAQIVVLPYQASTGSSSVLYQAASWGRPIIASDIHDICATAAESGLNIEYFKKGESASLAAAIHTLLNNPARRQLQAAHNYRAIQRLRPEEIGRLYLQAFNRALETRHSPKRLAIPSMFDLECC